MRKSSQRKLFLFGKYSLALLPPKKWLTELGIKEGDRAIVEFDRTKKRLIVSFSNDSPKQAPSKKPAKDEPEDWQPIKEL